MTTDGATVARPRQGRLARTLERAWWRRGPLALALLPLAALFGLIATLNRALYRHGWRACVRLPVPVIVVGNLIVGGAGKTPTVIAIVALLERHGHAPGIVSRGWGRARDAGVREVRADSTPATVGDEPLLLRRRTGVPVFVGADRVAAAHALLRLHPGVDVVVSDDGLQHHRLGRDVQVLVFDDRGVGNGWLLPAGPLREPVPSALPVDTLVLYNAAARSTRLPGALARRALGRIQGLADWHGGDATASVPLDRLRGRRLLAVAGLGNPQRFFDMLAGEGLSFDALALADHADYTVLPWPAGTSDVVTTEKDAVKLDPARMGTTQVWVAALDFAPAAGFDAELLQSLESAFASRRAAPTIGADHGNPSS